MSKLTKEWLELSPLNSDVGTWFIKATNKDCYYRPCTIHITESDDDEMPDGSFIIGIWDESEMVIIYEGTNFTIEKLSNLYEILTGKKLVNE